MNKKDMTKDDIKMVDETINEIGFSAYAIMNKMTEYMNKIKDDLRETEPGHFINIGVYNDSIKEYSERLTNLEKLSVAWYRKREGLDE